MSGPPASPSRIGCGNPGKGDRHGAESDPKDEADEERNEVCLVQFLGRVTNRFGRSIEIFLPSDDSDHVTELKTKPGHGRHLDVGASDTGDRHPKAIVEIELADGFSQDIAIGYDHAPKSDVALREHQVFLAPLADDTLEPLQVRGRANTASRQSV